MMESVEKHLHYLNDNEKAIIKEEFWWTKNHEPLLNKAAVAAAEGVVKVNSQ
jgi:hypothetical protein